MTPPTKGELEALAHIEHDHNTNPEHPRPLSPGEACRRCLLIALRHLVCDCDLCAGRRHESRQ